METEWISVLRFFGRLHPLTIHFPIGLLVVAFFLELLTIGGRRSGLRMGVNSMVYIGGAFAVLAVVLGLLLRSYDDYSGELVELHQSLGITTACLALVTIILLQQTLKGGLPNHLAYRISLTATVIALFFTGHLGASLTHGEDFLSSALYRSEGKPDMEKTSLLVSTLSRIDSLTETQQEELNLGVRAIFAHNCFQCHSENKQKGKLVLENKRGVYQGGESGAIIVAGKPEESELYRRISLPRNHNDVMPKKGKVLQTEEIELIKLWISNGAIWADRAVKIFPEASLALSKPNLPSSNEEVHPVDRLVVDYFKQNRVDLSEIVDDEAFIRRCYLDIVGLLPSPEQIAKFADNRSDDKRAKLIDDLLKDDHNYTAHWLSFWNDLLRNDYTGTGFITGGRKQITDWLYKSLLENKPYDQMVRELVNPTVESEGFIKGIQWRGVVNASQRTEMQAAQNIGQSLLGVNVKCASCHNSFVSNLTLEQSYGFAAIFADSTLELNRCDMPLGRMATTNFLYPELGSVNAATVKERLKLLSEVIVQPENGRLYRTMTNRIWKELMGRGIVEPVDAMDNEPWSQELLDWLAADFVDSGYDLKHLIRTIMTSDTYQLNSVNYREAEALKSNKYVFSGPTVRRMSAEQFSDAVSAIIAPVYHSVAYDPENEQLAASRIWHRERKFDRDVLPEPGKRYFRHLFTLPDKAIESARLLISVDHSFTLYVNGKEASQGDNWTKVEKVDLASFITNGENVLAIEGVNEGSIPNPAGILLALKILTVDGEEFMINSGRDWKSTASQPEDEWIDLTYNDEDWVYVINYGNRYWDKLVDFSFETMVGSNFARASLVRQHSFLKALGRPSRENVTTTREEETTLLLALELTNGEFFNDILKEGADRWIAEHGTDSEEIGQILYQKSFGRDPTRTELEIVVNVLGEQANQESLQDLFWATLLLPEFQFIF